MSVPGARLLWPVLLLLGALPAHAQIPGREAAPGFFDCPALVFFEPCPEAPATAAPPIAVGAASPPAAPPAERAPASPPETSLWVEPTEDGRVYVPPRQVREFLEHPSPETAQAYLEWNTQRIRALQRATAVLEAQASRQGLIPEGRAPGGGPGLGPARPQRPAGPPAPAPRAPTLLIHAPAPAPPTPMVVAQTPAPAVPTEATCALPPPPDGRGSAPEPPQALHAIPVAFQPNGSARPAPAGRVTAVYVFATWCGFSARTTPAVAAWARRHPALPVLAVAMDSPVEAIQALPPLPFPVQPGSQALKARLGIRAYPTLIIFRDGQPVYTHQGLATAAQLEDLAHALDL